MDFTKFTSLLDTQGLFFARADLLLDKWEGAFPLENIRQRLIGWAYRDWTENEEGAASLRELGGLTRFNEGLRRHTFMSCWHLNEVESAAMWKLYFQQNEGIAIRTTFERLISSFGEESNLFEVYIGKVSYLDYQTEAIAEGSTFVPFLHKRSSFEHEKELRAIIQPIMPSNNPVTEEKPFADGLLVSVDLRKLIESIYVAPTCEKWFKDLVENIATKYGLDAAVRQSSLSEGPMY